MKNIEKNSVTEIDFSDICKTYNPGLFQKKIRALQGLHLQVRRGEVFGLVGPNGAGKSTTIRLLLNLIRPDRGKITFRGVDLPLASLQKEIGYLPENPYLYDHLALDEFLDFGGRVSGMEKNLRKERISELVEKVKLSGKERLPLRSFSKGMRQRAAICFALLHDPSVIILDEPMSGLDPVGRRLFFDLISDLKAKGKTIFFCSHILNDVERLCDRIGILVGGRLVKVLERDQFQQPRENYLHLVVRPLSVEERSVLDGLSFDLQKERDGEIISLEAVRLPEVLRVLQKLQVDICGTRKERISLEEIFFDAVGEANL